MSNDNIPLPNIQALVTALPRPTMALGMDRFTGAALMIAPCLAVSALALAAWARLVGRIEPWVRVVAGLCLVMAMLSLILGVFVLVARMVLRLSEDPNSPMRLLDESWTGERQLSERLRAYPVDVLEALSRRLKVEVQLLERAGPRANLLGALGGGVTALWLAFSPLSSPDPGALPPQTAKQAKAEAVSPDVVKLLVAALAVGGTLAALVQNPTSAKLTRLELIVAEACLGPRTGAPDLSLAPVRQSWRQRLKAWIGRLPWLQALARSVTSCADAAELVDPVQSEKAA